MARALIRANAHLPGHPRGVEVEVDLTDFQVARAASGQITIVRTWGDGGAAERVAGATVGEVLGWVEVGEMTAEVALEAETAGRGRAGIVGRLTTAVGVPGGPSAAADVDAGVIGSEDGPKPLDEG